MEKTIIITSINHETEAIKRLVALKDWYVIIVADIKSKPIKSRANLIYLSVDDQKKMGYRCLEYLPFNHYCRKNIGYLFAIQNGAELIYDTDDDNIPYDDFNFKSFNMSEKVTSSSKYFNVYSLFSDKKVWPRGFPLKEICNNPPFKIERGNYEVGIVQALADMDPDVDAIYRLVIGENVNFRKEAVFALDAGIYTPLNSQSTFWDRRTFPFLYLPSFVSFRFTDILRGYIALRLAWEQNLLAGFISPLVYQERNAHDIMKDFLDEIPMYYRTEDVVNVLSKIKLNNNPLSDLITVYESMRLENIVTENEVESVKAWLADFNNIYK